MQFYMHTPVVPRNPNKILKILNNGLFRQTYSQKYAFFLAESESGNRIKKFEKIKKICSF